MRGLFLLSATACLLMGCRAPRPLISLLPENVKVVPPLASSGSFALIHCPPEVPRLSVLHEVERTFQAVHALLGTPDEQRRVRIALFTPDEPAGRRILRARCARDQHAAFMNSSESWIVVVGDWEKIRTRTDLRHEAAHQALCALTPNRFPPFWFSEGIATLFEAGVDTNDCPKRNPARQRNAAGLVGWRHRIRLAGLVDQQRPACTNADAYARAWALTSHLAQTKPHALRRFLKVWRNENLPPSETFTQTVLANTQLEQLERAVATTVR